MSVLDVEAPSHLMAISPNVRRAQNRVPILEPSSARLSTFCIIFLLTFVGGALRFAWLDKPPIWGDDALTYLKVAGTYDQMLDQLSRQGFGPLHYELYWWMRQHRVLTPTMMRLPPAICGTLMIPAMFFLAIQLVNRRAALLATVFTTFSAYMLNYSRDAKMYAELWFFATLSMACFLWWLRARTPLSWLCWIAATTAMVGIQLLGFTIVGIQLVMVLTGPKPTWRDWSAYGLLAINLVWIAVLLAIAVVGTPIAIVLSLVALLMTVTRRISTKYAAIPVEPTTSGGYRDPRFFARLAWHFRWTSVGMLILLGTAVRHHVPIFQLPSGLWIALRGEISAKPQLEWRLLLVTFATTLAILTICRPWSNRVFSIVRFVAASASVIAMFWVGPLVGTIFVATIFVLHGIYSWMSGSDSIFRPRPIERTDSFTRANAMVRRIAWTMRWPASLLFFVGVLIASSAMLWGYVNRSPFVERAVDDSRIPGIQWVKFYNQGRDGVDLLKFTATAWLYKWEWPRNYPTIGIVEINEIDPGTRRLLVAAMWAFVIIFALGALPWSRRLTRDDQSNPLTGDRAWWRRTLWLALWLIVPLYGVYVVCTPNAASPVEWLFNLTQSKELQTLRRPDVPQWNPNNVQSTTSFSSIAAFPRHLFAWLSAFYTGFTPYVIKVKTLIAAADMPWKLFASIGVGGLIYAMQSQRSTWGAVKRLAGGLAIAVVVLLVCMIVAAFQPVPSVKENIWMPRWVAVSWPAFAIIAGVLLARLPTKSLRWSAVAVVILINLGMHAHRLFATTEPPIDRMVADQDEATAPGSHTRFIYEGPGGGAPPGTGSFNGTVGAYYRTIINGGPEMSPDEFLFGARRANRSERGNGRRGLGQYFPGGNRASVVAEEINRSANVERVVVWDFFERGKVDIVDQLGTALGIGWRKTAESLFVARDHWTMRDLGTYRRREFARRRIDLATTVVTPTPTPVPVPGVPAPKPPVPNLPKPPATTRAATRPATSPATRPSTRPSTTRANRTTIRPATSPTTTAPAMMPPIGAKPATTPATVPAVPQPVVKVTPGPSPTIDAPPSTVPTTAPTSAPTTAPTSPPATSPSTAPALK